VQTLSSGPNAYHSIVAAVGQWVVGAVVVLALVVLGLAIWRHLK
jgi:hypothetical protein